MYYINTETKAYPITEGQIKAAFPNVSFPATFVAPQGYAEVLDSPKPSYDLATQKIVLGKPEQTDGKWYQQWAIESLTPQEIARIEENNKRQNKLKAEKLLADTDWTASDKVADPQFSTPYLTNQSAFLAYRSLVRAIAINPPTTPAVFPETPNKVWSN